MLLEQSGTHGSKRQWVSQPGTSDTAIRKGTGRGWDEWCDLIDQFEHKADGHAAIADHVRKNLGVGAWWAQSVTVGYERIVGLRLPYQRADGTFSANKSATVRTDADELRSMLLDDEERPHLFPGVSTELKSRPGTKAIRVAIGPGVATISFDDLGRGFTRVAIQHNHLPSLDSVEQWKFYWQEWLEAIEEEPSHGLGPD